MAAKTFAEIAKFNPYHDSKGRFASADSAASFTYAPGKSTAHDKAIQRGKESADTGKGFKGTLYHGSPATNIEEFDIERAGANTSSGEKLIYFTDSKQMAEDFSYERLEGSSKYFQRRGEKGRVYEVEVEMKNPLDFRNLSDKDIDNILQLDIDGILTRDMVKMYAQKNHQLLKAGLEITAETLKGLGYDGLIANTGKAGHNSLEYAVVDSSQTKIVKSAPTGAQTFDDILKFNPYHDARGRFASADSATSFTIRTKDPGKQHMADAAAAREKERDAAADSKEETPRMKAIHGIEDKIRNQHYETAAIVDDDGNVLLKKNGGRRQVGFTPMECAMMNGNTLTHNHPSSSIFSAEDISCFVANDMQEMRATTREGVTFSIKRAEGYNRVGGAEFLMEFQQNARKARATAQSELDAKGFQQKIWRGEITTEYANKEFGKVVTRELTSFCEKKAPDYNLEFTVENRSVSKSKGSGVYKRHEEGDDFDGILLDQETEDLNDAAFQEWLNRSTAAKAAPKSVLFIGLQISGAESLAIDGGEDTDDFHITLAYGHFDQSGDDDAVDKQVQAAIQDIRDLIPDSIHFDAIRRFQASESSDGKDVIYAQVAAGQLEKAHDGLLEALEKHGITLEGTFPQYKPHMTLAYIDPDEEYELQKIDATGTATKVMIGHGRESTKEKNYTIMKTDDDKRLVFGWASISMTVDGELLEDRQQDIIDPEDLEEAVYEYVLNFRDTGEEHIKSLRKKGKLVESCVFTAEKQKAMGIPEGILPIGWWIGFKIEDDDAWEKVKNGTYKMFSIEGKANRVPVEKAAPEKVIGKSDPDRFIRIEEFP